MPDRERSYVLRVGRKVGRTLYVQVGAEPSDDDRLVGMVDNRTLAVALVRGFNDHYSQVQRNFLLDAPDA